MENPPRAYVSYEALQKAVQVLLLPDEMCGKYVVNPDEADVVLSRFARISLNPAHTPVKSPPSPITPVLNSEIDAGTPNLTDKSSPFYVQLEDDQAPDSNSVPLCLKARSPADIESQLASQNKYVHFVQLRNIHLSCK